VYLVIMVDTVLLRTAYDLCILW